MIPWFIPFEIQEVENARILIEIFESRLLKYLTVVAHLNLIIVDNKTLKEKYSKNISLFILNTVIDFNCIKIKSSKVQAVLHSRRNVTALT